MWEQSIQKYLFKQWMRLLFTSYSPPSSNCTVFVSIFLSRFVNTFPHQRPHKTLRLYGYKICVKYKYVDNILNEALTSRGFYNSSSIYFVVEHSKKFNCFNFSLIFLSVVEGDKSSESSDETTTIRKHHSHNRTHYSKTISSVKPLLDGGKNWKQWSVVDLCVIPPF